jgi:biofilm PGA synthesis protein PgaA
MTSVSHRSLEVPAILLAALICAAPAHAQTPTQQREAAVLKARGGQRSEAIAALRSMLSSGVDDGLVAMDLVDLLQQDGQPGEAIAVYEKAAPREPPEYALLAATRAYRDVQRTGDAERLARQGAARFPEQPTWPLMLSLVLSDAGRTDEALVTLRQPAVSRAPPVERLMAEAHAWRRAGDPLKALHLYIDAIALSPANASAKNEAAGVLAGLNAPFGAAALAGDAPAIAAHQAGAMVRHGEMDLGDPAGRFDGTDAALARIDTLLGGLPPAETTLRRRLRLDRLVALRDRARMAGAKAEGDALRADAPLPPYAEAAYADALLYLRQPDAARDAYRRLLAQTPADVQARYGLFYALVELEDFSAAFAVIDGLVSAEPTSRNYQEDPTQYANPERTSAELAAAVGRFFGNQTGDAWDRLARLVAAAPAHAAIRSAASQVARARGWLRLSTIEAEIAASLAPDTVDARRTLAESAALYLRFDEADRVAAELLAQWPERQDVQKLARDLAAIRRWVVEFDAEPSNGEGGGENASGQAVTLQGRLSSPPIANHWRIFLLSTYADAHPPEGFVDRGRGGFGVEWRSAYVTANVFPTWSWGALSKQGGGATVDWLATDHVHLSFGAERFSTETPLRALRLGITADDYSMRATYRWHEARSVSGNFAYQPFSDDNRRLTGGIVYRELFANWPKVDLTAVVEAYASDNTRTDAPYYNPARDLSASGGIRLDHRAWRRYDRSFTQVIGVDAGLYSQSGFRNDWIGTLAYEHHWRFDPLTSFRYGVRLTRRVYDGVAEQTLVFTTGVSQRF